MVEYLIIVACVTGVFLYGWLTIAAIVSGTWWVAIPLIILGISAWIWWLGDF